MRTLVSCNAKTAERRRNLETHKTTIEKEIEDNKNHLPAKESTLTTTEVNEINKDLMSGKDKLIAVQSKITLTETIFTEVNDASRKSMDMIRNSTSALVSRRNSVDILSDILVIALMFKALQIMHVKLKQAA